MKCSRHDELDIFKQCWFENEEACRSSISSSRRAVAPVARRGLVAAPILRARTVEMGYHPAVLLLGRR